MKKILYIVLFISTLSMSGCNDFLNMSPHDKTSDKLIWTKPEYAELYVNNFYALIHRYGQFDIGQSQVGLTEGLTETLKYGSMTSGTHVGFANQFVYAEGGMTAKTASWNIGMWDQLYGDIRRVNEFLYGLDKYAITFSTEDKIRFEAEARFYRGYLYYELIKRHGKVVLYDKDIIQISRNKALSTEAQGWDMVEQDLDFAAKNMPAWSAANKGRVTRAAAYAMQSRAMLYAKRWSTVKSAAEELLKFGYKLMPGKTAKNYQLAFTSAMAGNTESILEFNYKVEGGPNHIFDEMFTPAGDGPANGARAVPTQEMVESYEYADGSGLPNWATWHNSTTGTTTEPPYRKLEPRFAATILYNGCTWKNRTIEAYVGSEKDGWCSFKNDPNPAGRTTTGYFLRKLVDETHIAVGGSVPSVQPWIAIRLAEVMLNYAEACYELKEPNKANDMVRQIRDRVGLTYSDKSGTAIMDAIRQERKVELAYEGHLYWDMRRWRLAHTQYSGPGSRVHGLKIEKQGALFTYTYVDCDKQDRYFGEKMYIVPMPETELQNNSDVEQYPEWR